MKEKVLLSVIVPAYKQELTIRKDLENIDITLKKGLGESFDYEIVCVVDGELDNTKAEAEKTGSSKIKVFSIQCYLIQTILPGKFFCQSYFSNRQILQGVFAK